MIHWKSEGRKSLNSENEYTLYNTQSQMVQKKCVFYDIEDPGWPPH
jgi:hypothetical protein